MDFRPEPISTALTADCRMIDDISSPPPANNRPVPFNYVLFSSSRFQLLLPGQAHLDRSSRSAHQTCQGLQEKITTGQPPQERRSQQLARSLAIAHSPAQPPQRKRSFVSRRLVTLWGSEWKWILQSGRDSEVDMSTANFEIILRGINAILDG